MIVVIVAVMFLLVMQMKVMKTMVEIILTHILILKGIDVGKTMMKETLQESINLGARANKITIMKIERKKRRIMGLQLRMLTPR